MIDEAAELVITTIVDPGSNNSNKREGVKKFVVLTNI
jgi:hypothetical protein